MSRISPLLFIIHSSMHDGHKGRRTQQSRRQLHRRKDRRRLERERRRRHRRRGRRRRPAPNARSRGTSSHPEHGGGVPRHEGAPDQSDLHQDHHLLLSEPVSKDAKEVLTLLVNDLQRMSGSFCEAIHKMNADYLSDTTHIVQLTIEKLRFLQQHM